MTDTKQQDRYDGSPYVTDTDYLLHEIRDLLLEIKKILVAK